MNEIPTAEKFLKTWQSKFKTSKPIILESHKTLLIEFAKLHVEAALNAASKNVKIINDPYSYTGNTGSEYPPEQIVSKDSILNAYPIENIK